VKPFADALELSTHYVGNDISPIIDALRAAKAAVDVPVFMKLSPHPNISADLPLRWKRRAPMGWS